METRLLVGGIAALAAFACLFAATYKIGGDLRRRWTSLASQGGSPTVSSLALWRLRNGFSSVRPLAARLMRSRRVSGVMEDVAHALDVRGKQTEPEALLSITLVALAALSLVSWLVVGSLVGAVAVPACVAAVVSVFAAQERDKRQEALRDAVPSALESMSVCFGSGFTLLQTFKQVSEDVPDPLGATFGKSAHILEMGGSAEDALSELRDGAHASELAFVAVALDVQHQSGGAIRQVLDAATDTVKGELALRRTLRVQTAQAKLSARVVAVMPFILVAAFSLASPGFLSPFFESPLGFALLALAIVMQLAGILLVRRALAVEGVS